MTRNLIYHTHVPAKDCVIAQTSTGCVETELSAIARDGITLTCNRATLDQLFHNTRCVAPKQPKQITVEFDLPTSGQTLEIDGEVFSLRRLSRESYQLEMKFETLDEQQRLALDTYIDHILKVSGKQVKNAVPTTLEKTPLETTTLKTTTLEKMPLDTRILDRKSLDTFAPEKPSKQEQASSSQAA